MLQRAAGVDVGGLESEASENMRPTYFNYTGKRRGTHRRIGKRVPQIVTRCSGQNIGRDTFIYGFRCYECGSTLSEHAARLGYKIAHNPKPTGRYRKKAP